MTSARLLFSRAIDGFLMARSADGYSAQTVAQYRWALERLAERVGEKPVTEVDINDLRSFLVYLREDYSPKHKDKLSDVSIFHAWKAIRAFYKWATPELEIPNVSMKITQPKHAYPEIIPFTESDIKRLLRACDFTQGQRQRRPSAIRDRAMVMTLLDTGVRVGEMCRLNLEDANLPQAEIHIRPQGSGYKSKSRVLPLGTGTQKTLWKYLATRETKPSDPLFLTIRGARINNREIQHFCKRLGDRASVPNCHPHRFRHSFAVMYLRNKGDIFTLKRLLGHASWKMVNHYLSLAEADVHEAHRRASPIDNISGL